MAVGMLENINKKYSGKGLLTVTATGVYDKENAVEFVNYTGLTLPVLLDEGIFSYIYGARGVPNFFLLDKNHNLSNNWPGYAPVLEETISNEIENILSTQ
jgi:thioredoxin-related protein